ncbi:SRPBCC domain-containing protein [Paenibacillus oryzisoli]|uniref:SRPBCC family protein n=1 Tax=Paenibacillus oryzisoli TaxID=1850517 RepID=UPI003D2B1202
MENQTNQLTDIVQTLVLGAPVQKVWNAVATSEGIATWFMPNNFKPELGYEFHLEAGPFGKSPCKVTELDEPNRLTINWGKDWFLRFDLKDLDGKTEFTLTHGGWDIDKVTEFGQPHDQVRGMMAQGWAGIVERLRAHLEG